MSEVFAIIGGSGFDMSTCGDYVEENSVETPYGACSAPLQIYRHQKQSVIFLPRHGNPHRIPPHRINYRANIWALQKIGCSKIIAINTVGGIGADASVGALVIPEQIIDYTYGREHTFSDCADVPLLHVDFTSPFSAPLRHALITAAAAIGIPTIDQGVYGATQGPRLESAAEINRLQRDGCDIVGMTAMPEAALARELNIEYASLCLVVNLAAGRGEAITVAQMQKVSARGMGAIAKIIAEVLASNTTPVN
ncbi:MAG: 5-methylthioadenosine phosphorylase [Verrucomicrobiaceae bacterium]|nr:5-methylthioadenosine phosphorylase [Verrucomicrobiaceae bacterium]